MDHRNATPEQLQALNERAWQLAEAQPQEALELARHAESSAREASDGVALGLALRTVGACSIALGETGEALGSLNEAEELLRPVGAERRGLVQVRRLLARACFLEHEYEGALRHAHDALEACQGLPAARLRAEVENDAGMIYAHLGSFREGLEYLLGSVRTLESEGVPPTGKPLNNIGNIYMLQGDHERALDFFERARRLFDESGSSRDRVIVLGNVGRALEALGEPSRARSVHEEAVRLARGNDDRLYLPPALTKLGTVLSELGDREGALACFEEALALSDGRTAGWRNETLRALADLHLQAGEFERAEPLLQEALELGRSSNDRSTQVTAYHGLARLYESAGRHREALEFYRRYHDLDTTLVRELFSNQTQALLLHNEVKQSKHDRKLLREMNEQLRTAYEELYELHRALEDKNADLERLSLEDPLTGLSNRRHLETRLAGEIARFERYGEVFSVIMCDIDDFKAVNDLFSHAVGDRILVEFARILTGSIRSTDMVARVGGEEFILLLPHTRLSEAVGVAEKLRSAVETFPWERIQAGLVITTSAGVTEVRANCETSCVLAVADRELYRAKRLGKNSVCAGHIDVAA